MPSEPNICAHCQHAKGSTYHGKILCEVSNNTQSPMHTCEYFKIEVIIDPSESAVKPIVKHPMRRDPNKSPWGISCVSHSDFFESDNVGQAGLITDPSKLTPETLQLDPTQCALCNHVRAGFYSANPGTNTYNHNDLIELGCIKRIPRAYVDTRNHGYNDCPQWEGPTVYEHRPPWFCYCPHCPDVQSATNSDGYTCAWQKKQTPFLRKTSPVITGQAFAQIQEGGLPAPGWCPKRVSYFEDICQVCGTWRCSKHSRKQRGLK